MVGAIFNIQKVCENDHEENATDQANPRPTTTCRRDREKDGKKQKNKKQTATKRIKHPLDLTPAQQYLL